MDAIDVLTVTPTYSWPIPNPDDPDDVPTDLSELAVAIENTVKGGALIPKPAVNGQWIKGVGGLPVWSAITPADIAGLGTSGLHANRPAASAANAGAIYAATDRGGTWQSNGSTWTLIAQRPYLAAPGQFPATPYDGEELILVDGATNPLYEWRLRYNASNTTAYKWEMVGGSDYTTSGTLAWSQINAWTPLLGFSVPRAGIYQMVPAYYAVANPGAASALYVGVGVQNVQSVQAATVSAPAGYWTNVVGAEQTVTVAAAAQFLQVTGFQSAAINGNLIASMAVRPKSIA